MKKTLKQRPYRGMDKKPVTEMSNSKIQRLLDWCEKRKKMMYKLKRKNANQPTIKINVGMEYKNGSK
tara:strand:+ start:9889 stop:10089 length:201 start_codon:yes stop_codon:yes gene_type:complete